MGDITNQLIAYFEEELKTTPKEAKPTEYCDFLNSVTEEWLSRATIKLEENLKLSICQGFHALKNRSFESAEYIFGHAEWLIH